MTHLVDGEGAATALKDRCADRGVTYLHAPTDIAPLDLLSAPPATPGWSASRVAVSEHGRLGRAAWREGESMRKTALLALGLGALVVLSVVSVASAAGGEGPRLRSESPYFPISTLFRVEMGSGA